MAKADSPTKLCGEDGCSRPHRARGLCSTHYNHAFQSDRYKRLSFKCGWCGRSCTKTADASRGYRHRFCSFDCLGAMKAYEMVGPMVTPLPKWHAAHPARVARGAIEAARLAAIAEQLEPRPCDECGDVYTPGTTIQRYCTVRCARRVARRERKAREHGASGSFTWTQVIGLFLLFGRRCAYCAQEIEGQPDPDHVVPLSKGGHNSIGNILPACRTCNCDKRDVLLHEWNADRARRGLPPRITTWSVSDKRYAHLTAQRVCDAA